MKYIRVIVTRAIFFYIVFALVIGCIPWFSVAARRVVAMVLSVLTPDLNYFEEFVNVNKRYDPVKLKLSIDYHKRVVQVFPQERPAAYQVIGFCYDRLGDPVSAEKFYQMSLEVLPGSHFFWPYYNLGILAFRRGDNNQAVEFFQKALEKDKNVNYWLWANSKVFNDVRLSDTRNSGDYFFEHIKEARQQSFVLLMEGLVRLKDYDKLFMVIAKGSKDNPGQESVFYYYGGVGYFALGQYNEALMLFQLAVKAKPNYSDAFMYMGKCLQAIGREDLAGGSFSKGNQIIKNEGVYMEKLLNPAVRFF